MKRGERELNFSSGRRHRASDDVSGSPIHETGCFVVGKDRCVGVGVGVVEDNSGVRRAREAANITLPFVIDSSVPCTIARLLSTIVAGQLAHVALL